MCKQKTAYEMRISDWSSDVCSSDLQGEGAGLGLGTAGEGVGAPQRAEDGVVAGVVEGAVPRLVVAEGLGDAVGDRLGVTGDQVVTLAGENLVATGRSEEHTSELQSLMRISYAVFCLKKNKQLQNTNNN